MGQKYKMLMAKTDSDGEEAWLPLWMHLRDTAGIMRKLAVQWIPDSVYLASGMDSEQFLKTAVFVGAIHDIGKATSYFQSVITRSCPEKYDEIMDNGFILNKVYRAAGKTPHAYAGQWILQSEKNGFGIHESIAMVVGAHHGKPISQENSLEEIDWLQVYPINFYGVKKDVETIELWKNSWQHILEQAIELAGVGAVDELPELSLEAQVLLSGLLIMADWIASNTAYFPLIPLDSCGDESVYPKRTHDGWERVALPEGWSSQINVMDENMFWERFDFFPNEVQKYMLKAVNESKNPGIFILEAQMGVGKTEAALAAAEILACRKHEGGIFIGMPTQATSNGIFGRLCEWGERVSEETTAAVKLAHNSAEFQEEYQQLIMKGRANLEEDGWEQEGLSVHPWFQGSKRALLADFVIGTVDQFLMAVLKRKHFMLRHIGLVDKVVIIDECHAYDAYMNEYLDRALQWMAAYGVPVILLSATLSADRRKALTECYVKAYTKYQLGKKKPEITYKYPDWERTLAYPLLTWTDGEQIEQVKIEQTVEEKEVQIHCIRSVAEMLYLLKERLEDGGCACIIANTVKAAQDIYMECVSNMEDMEIVLYHAQFIMPDRYKKEQYLLEKMGKHSKDTDRDGLILIGTQVLEQSLDYDADIMVTQLCPIDLLLQRIGRLQRHKRDGSRENYSRPEILHRPECMILLDENENYDSGSRAVYGDYLLMRTKKVLGNNIKIPGDIPILVQKVYNEEDDLELYGEGYLDALNEYCKNKKSKKQEAKQYLMKAPTQKDMSGILDDANESSEKMAEASVRDTEGSIEVLVMKKNVDGDILFMGDHDAPALSPAHIPDNENGRKIVMQKLRLPHIFVSRWNRKKVIEELEGRNRKELPGWQLSPWIRGELILLLDQNGQTELNGYQLSYSYEKGLEYKWKEEKNERDGI